MRVSAKAWFEYQQKLHQVNAKAEQAMSEFMDKNWPADSQDMINYAYALTQRYGSAAVELACQMYDRTAAASSAYVKPAEPAELASYEDVSKLVYGTLNTPKETPRGVNRLVKRAAADTTLKNAKRDHAEWAWIPSGDTCAFCLTLASRGWQKASKAVLKGNHAQHVHANCDCNFQIRFSHKDTVEGYDPDKYLKMYEEAEGNSPDEKIKSLRRQLTHKTDQEFIEEKIASGDWGTKINSEKQAPHMELTHTPGKSYLFKGEDPQKLLEKYSGQGRIELTRNGKRTNREIVICDHDIGIDARSGKTNVLKIHHSKNRTHVVPRGSKQ